MRPLFVELQLAEQRFYPDHPQLTQAEIEGNVDRVPARFEGENVVFAVREAGRLAGFCWCVLFDPGTGLEGEIAEVYVAESARGRGLGQALVKGAVELFKKRGVTLGYVWTRDANEAAVHLYKAAGFVDSPQLVLTWYPANRARRRTARS